MSETEKNEGMERVSERKEDEEESFLREDEDDERPPPKAAVEAPRETFLQQM
jgi:hypothetical protein